MDRKSLRDSGLLEQYLLGLTSLEETQIVDDFLKTDPEIRMELEHLRLQLGLYVKDKMVDSKSDHQRESLEPLDHQVIQEMGRKNQVLKKWRYGLAAACLALFFSTLHFYHISEDHKAAFIGERARHAQDDNLHAQELKHLGNESINWDSIHTIVTSSKHGGLQFHYLPADSVVLLDLSHLQKPEEGFAYFVFIETADGVSTTSIVDANSLHGLHPLNNLTARLRILYWPQSEKAEQAFPEEGLIAELSLNELPNFRR